MEVSVKCRKCRKTFIFSTNGKKIPLYKTEGEKPPRIFVKKCPYCGTANEVKVEGQLSGT